MSLSDLPAPAAGTGTHAKEKGIQRATTAATQATKTRTEAATKWQKVDHGRPAFPFVVSCSASRWLARNAKSRKSWEAASFNCLSQQQVRNSYDASVFQNSEQKHMFSGYFSANQAYVSTCQHVKEFQVTAWFYDVLCLSEIDRDG